MSCPHPAWVHVKRTDPLVCASCGLMWPARQLPDPYLKPEGYDWKKRP